MIRPLGLALALTTLVATPVVAQQQPTDSTARILERLQRQIDSLRMVAERQNQRLMELDERGAAAPGQPRSPYVTTDSAGRRKPLSIQGIYGKPFVKRFGGGTAVGGYVDLEYRNDLTNKASAFDQHRLVPFIFSEITDRLHFGTEIEFEHGPRLEIENEDDVATPEGNGEINVEFATIDYQFAESFNLRGGVILAPLGRFNLVHDSPVNDLTDRPLVNQFVIPTTLSESGLGFFGTLYPSARSLLTYEAYVVNGYSEELVEDGRINIREAAGPRGGVDAVPKALVGRLAFSPFLGFEVGASAHTGEYEIEPTTPTDEELEGEATIWALDATLQRGRYELLGEYARLGLSLPASLSTTLPSDTQDGFYVQGNVHFGQGLLVPRQTSTFTGVVRWDRVNFKGATNVGDAASDRLERVTFGLNWRPIEDAAIKTDYQMEWNTPTGGTRGKATNRVLLSLATYF